MLDAPIFTLAASSSKRRLALGFKRLMNVVARTSGKRGVCARSSALSETHCVELLATQGGRNLKTFHSGFFVIDLFLSSSGSF